MSLLLDALKQAERVKAGEDLSETGNTDDVLRPTVDVETISLSQNDNFNEGELVQKNKQLSKELPFEVESSNAFDQNLIDGVGEKFPFHHPKTSSNHVVDSEINSDIDTLEQERVLVSAKSTGINKKVEDHPQSIDVPVDSGYAPDGREWDAAVTEGPLLPAGEVTSDPEKGSARHAEDVLRVTRNSRWHNRGVIVAGFVVMIFAGIGGYFFLLEQLPEPVAIPSMGTFSPSTNDLSNGSEKKPSRVDFIDPIPLKNGEDKLQLSNESTSDNKPVKTEPSKSSEPSDEPIEFPEAIKIRKTKLRVETGRWLNSAYQSYLQQDYESAEQDYLKVLNRSSENTDALLGLGSIAEKQGFTAKARRYYLKALEQNPDNVYAKAALTRKANTLSTIEKESQLKTLIRQYPTFSGLYFSLGNQYAEQGQWAEAQIAYFQASELDPKRLEYILNLAVSMDHLSKFDIALQYYRKALRLAASSPTHGDMTRVEKRISQLMSK